MRHALVEIACVFATVCSVASGAERPYTLRPTQGQWLEAEDMDSHSGTRSCEGPECSGRGYVAPSGDKASPLFNVAVGVTGDLNVWARVRGRGVALKEKTGKEHWRWPKCDTWRWTLLGKIAGSLLSPSFTVMGNAAVDVVVVTGDLDWRPVDLPDSVAALNVDFSQTKGEVSKRLASANINSPAAMLPDHPDWDRAVRSLGIRMMRFQVPPAQLDYRERDRWDEETYAVLDRAVTAARERWGVTTLMFGVHRLRLPMADGKLLPDEFDEYADGIARLVRRYAAPGQARVEYWEPFNELDHPNFLKKLAAHAQDFTQVAQLYAVCSKAIKAVNPELKVGGPAAMWPGGWETRIMLQAPGMTADFVSWHQYSTGNAATSDEQILGSIHRQKGLVDGLQRMQDAVREAGVAAPMEYLMTEFHINHSAWNPPDRRLATAFSAVFAASVLINMGQRGADALMIHDVRSKHYGLIGPLSGDGWSRESGTVSEQTGDDPIHVRPVGWVYRWFNEHMSGEWAACDWVHLPADWDGHARTPLMEAAASVKGTAGVVLLINRSMESREAVLTGLTDVAPARAFDDLSVQCLVIDDHGPSIERVAGASAAGWLRRRLPPMSVSFIRFTRSTLE